MTARPATPAPYRCHTCGEGLTSWAACERHADTERHHRLEVVLLRIPLGSTAIDEGSPMKQKKAKDHRDGQRRMGEPRPNSTLTASGSQKRAADPQNRTTQDHEPAQRRTR